MILPPEHTRRTVLRAFAAGLRDANRPWSIGIDVLVLAGFLALMCWEVGEFAFTGDCAHLVAAVVVLAGGAVYAFRAFTTTD